MKIEDWSWGSKILHNKIKKICHLVLQLFEFIIYGVCRNTYIIWMMTCRFCNLYMMFIGMTKLCANTFVGDSKVKSRMLCWTFWSPCPCRKKFFEAIAFMNFIKKSMWQRVTYLIEFIAFQGNWYSHPNGDWLRSIQASYWCTISISMTKWTTPLLWWL